MPEISGISRSAFGDGASITITGSDFGTTQGTVTIGGQPQTITQWFDNSVTFTAVRGSQNLGTARLAVVKGAGVTVNIQAAGAAQEIAAGGTITGTAPLAVWMSARTSTSTQWADESTAFRSMACHWDFGYDASGRTALGNWTHSGTPKWRYIGGPITGHVFETPGTYTVRCKVGDGSGSGQAEFTVVVADPNTTYAGANTICLTMDGSTSDGPTGCSYVNVSSGWPTFLSDRRYLLKRGQNYESIGTITFPEGLQNTQFGGYGSGAKPLVRGVGGNATQPTVDDYRCKSVSVYDLQANLAEFVAGIAPRDLLFLRCDGSAGISFNSSAGWYWLNGNVAHRDKIRWGKRVFAVDCNVVMTQPNAFAGSYPSTGGVINAVVMGCELAPNHLTVESFSPAEGPWRTFSAYEACWQHNYAHNPRYTKSHHKLHSGGGQLAIGAPDFGTGVMTDKLSDAGSLHPLGATYQPRMITRWMCLGYNKYSSGTPDDICSWSLSIRPQNDDSSPYEVVRDVIVEFENFRQHFGGTPRSLVVDARNVTVRSLINSAHPWSFGTHALLTAAGVNGPYYSDQAPPVGSMFSNGASLISVPAFVDPGKPTGAA